MSKLDTLVASLPYTPSAYQVAIAEWVISGRGNAVVDAKAGAGKTSTLVDIIAPLLAGTATFCAFNKHIANELGSKLRGTSVQCKTLHGIGFSAIGYSYGSRPRVDQYKYRNLVQDMLTDICERGRFDGREASQDIVTSALADSGSDNTIHRAAADLVSKIRTALVDVNDWTAIQALALHHGITLESAWTPALHLVLRAALHYGLQAARHTVDFDDMVWVPNVDSNVRPYQSDWVLVDECQDLNAAQRGLALQCVRRGGRMLFVGDPNQAIYGFAGADSESFQRIIDATDAVVLPLNFCYRCPSKVIELAQAIVPAIQAAPGAAEGTITNLPYGKVADVVEEGDMVLCRLTAPLVSLCLSLIGSGVPARVKGRDIGKGLVKLLRKALKRARKTGRPSTLADVPEALEAQITVEQKKLEAKGLEEDDLKIQALHDRRDALLAIYSWAEDAETVQDLERAIEELFADTRASVTLCTVHRAKGLESDRVFILQEEKMPLPFVSKPWEVQQEYNLRYVALTRAKKELVFIR